MGVERSVTRWYIERQTILNEIVQLEARLAQMATSTDLLAEPARAEDTTVVAQVQTGENEAELQQQLTIARERLRNMGPCPKPMMG